MKLEPLLENIELFQNTTNENTFNIFFDFETKRFHAIENTDVDKRTFIFEMVDTEENIAREYRDKILNYALCKYNDSEIVTIGDIFMQGEFIKQIN